ncbi:hypothetical protein CLV47_101111 [Antricoccus suffuscus]|uniref:Lipoprotein LpqN n=1 Tax=Antricoccus suffuscus TaxID=1629062 RepID=A0A2T1A683_9ACTN|nr:hypothetical protein [Antricoccus suffuscus]PRZ43987.1 hypothetical protein CLV47_101111 [Antricoccus suffuscus]
MNRPSGRKSRLLVLSGVVAVSVGVLGACSGSTKTAGAESPSAAHTSTGAHATESNPPGDIPDTIAYVDYKSADGAVQFVHPEGWSSTKLPNGVMFTDKLNSVSVSTTSGSAPTVDSVKSTVVPKLGTPSSNVKVNKVTAATLPAGPAIKVLWQTDSAPDPVTGKVYRNDVVTYVVGAKGSVTRMDLSGPVGADNVDPYKKMSDSLKIK